MHSVCDPCMHTWVNAHAHEPPFPSRKLLKPVTFAADSALFCFFRLFLPPYPVAEFDHVQTMSQKEYRIYMGTTSLQS